MKKLLNIHGFLSLTLLMIFLSACKRDKGEILLQPRGERDIVEVMQRETNGDFSLFLEALQITGLKATLEVEPNKEPSKRYIVFAPVNKAFSAALFAGGITKLSEVPVDVLTAVVKAHIHELPSAGKNLRLDKLGAGDYKTLQAGREVYVTYDCDGRAYLQGSVIIAFERAAKNGYVYAVEDVIPEHQSNLWEAIQNDPDLTVFKGLIQKVNFDTVLTKLDRGYTVLAPSNTGLNDYGIDASIFNTPAELAYLDSMLRLHVIPGRYYGLDMCLQKPYRTLLGQDVLGDAAGNWGGRYGDWVFIEETNVHLVKNGVIHRLDYPFTLDIGSFRQFNARQCIYLFFPENVNPNNSFALAKQALSITGLDKDLEKLNRFTIYVPTDAAFNDFLQRNNYSSIYALPVDKLTEIMKYHVMTAPRYYFDFTASPATCTGAPSYVTLPTLQGERLSTLPRNRAAVAGCSSGQPGFSPVNNYNPAYARADITTANGIIHTVRKVVVPKGVNLASAPLYP
jgi:uncharacterized surface protein with fasciclin (FAS1) repeats